MATEPQIIEPQIVRAARTGGLSGIIMFEPEVIEELVCAWDQLAKAAGVTPALQLVRGDKQQPANSEQHERRCGRCDRVLSSGDIVYVDETGRYFHAGSCSAAAIRRSIEAIR